MTGWLNHRGARLGSTWLLLVALLILGTWSVRPPSPLGADAALDRFSADRALLHVSMIASEPHPMGSAEIVLVRDYLQDELRTLGLSPVEQRITVPAYYGPPNRTVEVVNVMARIPGSDSTGAIVLMGHYDSEPATPGANDNSAAVATLLETARAVQAWPQLRNDVVLLFTDGEEPAPRFGSTAFVAEHPWAADSRLVVNLEAIGGSGPSLLIETNGSDRWLIDGFTEASQHPATFSFVTGIVEAIDAGATDFTPFQDAGVPGLNFAYLGWSSIYHTPDDALGSVSLASVQHHGEHTTSVLAAFGNADLAGAVDDEATVFFTIGSGFVIRYGAAWAIPLVVLAAIGVIGALRFCRRGRGRSVIAGARRVGLHMMVAGVLAAVGWRLATTFSHAPSALESTVYLAVFASVAAGFYALRSPGENAADADPAGGSLVVWLVFAIVTTMLVPAAGYVFLWPVVAGTLAIVWTARSTNEGAAAPLARLGLVAAPTFVLLVPAVDFLFQLAQPRPGNTDSELLEVVAVVAIIVMLMIELIGPYVRPAAGSESPSPASSETMSSATSTADRPVVSTAGNRP